MTPATRIFILYTGGTIGMSTTQVDDTLSPSLPLPELVNLLGFDAKGDANADSIMPVKNHVVSLASLNTQQDTLLHFVATNKLIDSANTTPSDWVAIANAIQSVYQSYDAFVVLHGTDTMAYTASALSFMFNDLNKPIILTGSQLPLVDAASDARRNAEHAIRIAGYKVTGLPCVPEVVIAFGGSLLRGCRARKISATDFAAFSSPNYPPLGTMNKDITINSSRILPMPSENAPCVMTTALANHAVACVYLFPATPSNHMTALLASGSLAGYVLCSYGRGNAPSDKPFLEAIGQATQAGKVILNVTQCVHGSVSMGCYATSNELLRLGVFSGFDMTPEAALAKVMMALTIEDKRERSHYLSVAQRGEQIAP